MTITLPTHHLDDHADNHPDDVVEAARDTLTDWMMSQDSVGKDPAVCAAAAIFKAYHEAGYGRYDSDRATRADIAAEFDRTPQSISQRIQQFPGDWSAYNPREDTTPDATGDTEEVTEA